MIYLDYASATPVDKEVLKTYIDITTNYFANPNSIHPLGLEANKKLNEASENIAKILGVEKEELIYTSGATEANNLVIKGVAERYKNRGKHILLSSLEHQSIISPATTLEKEGFEVELIPLDSNGQVDIDELKSMLRKDTILVSVTSVDSELGITQPINEIGKLLKDTDTIFHTDATQIIGKIPLNLENIDLITINPHKFYGINGTGLLIKKKNIQLIPQIEGGRSSTIYRSGTPVTPSVVALSKALELAIKNEEERQLIVKKYSNQIVNKLKEYKNIHLNSNNLSICNIINFSIKNVSSKEVIDHMNSNNICLSAKTSCCPINTPSKLVYALTKSKQLATTSVRVSLSHLTKQEEVDKFLEVLDKFYKEKFNGKI